MTTEGQTAAQPQFAHATLSGDIRDVILAEFKSGEKPWQKMNEDEQDRLIQRASHIAETVVKEAVDIVAAKGLPALPIGVGKVTIDGAECKGTFECYADDDALLRIRHLQGARAMFVLASPDAFHGERKAAEAEVVGDLAIPKTGPGAPSDPEGIAKVGRGNVAAE